MALRDKRKMIIEFIKSREGFLKTNAQALDIYHGNLLPYVDRIMSESLSKNYYQSIKHRILPINILQRYIDKVSTTYSSPPERSSQNDLGQAFIEFYSKQFNINVSGQQADIYSNLFKGFAWEPYLDKNGKPKLREIPYDSFMVMSESSVSPDEETIFIKFMGQMDENPDSMLLFVYTDEEFDAFLMNGNDANQFLIDNQGINPIGTIPFVYGKRQRNKLIPTLDTDMLSITKAIPTMISDGAGAQMYQAFSIFVGIDVQADNMKMSPNAFWSLKSDRESDKNPQITTIKPEADTDKVMQFITTVFVLWLETKGIRVGSIGSMDAGNMASGVSKIIDEMDVFEVKRRSMEWFEMDEWELWNKKLPAIHNHWIRSGQVMPAELPGMVPDNFDMEIDVEFQRPEPMISRMEEVNQIKAEVELGTMTLDQAIRKLHPEFTDEQVAETIAGRALI